MTLLEVQNMQISNANLGQTKKDYELKLTHQLQS